jgi:V/A-type H+-transporting ATPase subunit A
MTENNTAREKIVGVNGNLITVRYTGRVMQNEVAYAIVGDARLKCEVIRVRGDVADLQVFESTNGLKVGDEVEFTGELLSVELGPGLLTQVYDGLQNPLKLLAEHSGFFLQRGIYLRALDREAKWQFTPSAQAGDTCVAGDRLGSVPEGIIKHYIMIPFSWRGSWTIESIVPAGEYTFELGIFFGDKPIKLGMKKEMLTDGGYYALTSLTVSEM